MFKKRDSFKRAIFIVIIISIAVKLTEETNSIAESICENYGLTTKNVSFHVKSKTFRATCIDTPATNKGK